jgi:hypothetical protein
MAERERVRVVFDPDYRHNVRTLGELFLDPIGKVILAGERRRLPRSNDGSYGRPPGYANSRLRELERGRDPEPYSHLGTDAVTPEGDSYPAMLEHGTKAHVITPKEPGYPLRDPRTGRVFGYRVQHPGTKPIPWARRSAMDIHGRVFRL